MFRKLVKISKNPMVIYKSDLHRKAILAMRMDSKYFELAMRMDSKYFEITSAYDYCRIVELLFNKYPSTDKENSRLLKELTNTKVQRKEYVDSKVLGHRSFWRGSTSLTNSVAKVITTILNKNDDYYEKNLLKRYKEMYKQFRTSVYFK